MYGQIIIGPAGSGKSTYCNLIQSYAKNLQRNILIVNLDPAAEKISYSPDVDIRELINTDDVMDFTKLGPNGGLIYSMEYLIENIDWLEDQIGTLGPDDYVLFDCPGQLELYTHLDIMHRVRFPLTRLGCQVSQEFRIQAL
jgi:GTPase SAR1 family protein